MTEEKRFAGIIDGDQQVELVESHLTAETEDGQPLAILRRRRVEATSDPPVVLVHGFAQNARSWDLTGRSLQNYLVSSGFDTFNVELRGHSASRAAGSRYADSFEDYHARDAPAVLEAVRQASGAGSAFFIGHSLGGSIGLAFAVRHPELISGLIAIGTPTHYGRVSRHHRRFGAVANWLYRRGLLDRLRYAPARATGRLVMRHRWFFDRPNIRFPLAVWQGGSMESEVLEERTIEGWDRAGMPIFATLARWFATPQGNLSDDGSVDYSAELAHLAVPVLFLVGNRDAVVPPHSVEVGYRLCGSRDKTLTVIGGGGAPDFGHIDLISGRHAPATTWRAVAQWLTARSG